MKLVEVGRSNGSGLGCVEPTGADAFHPGCLCFDHTEQL